MRGGVYQVDQTFALDALDSGELGSPVTYAGYPGENARLVGGVNVPASWFGPVTDPAVRNRLSPEAVDQVLVADLAGNGITEYGEILQRGFLMPPVPVPAELFVDGEVQTLARYPNDGFVKIASVIDPGGYPHVCGDPQCEQVELAKQATFTYSDPRPESWQSLDDVWMTGYWGREWADGNLRISSIDPAADSVTTATSSWFSMNAGARYHYYNVLEELDQPSEYYIDRPAGKLYFYPQADLPTADVRLSQLDAPLVSVNNATHVTLENLTFESSRSDGVIINNGSDNTVDGVTIRGVGGIGVVAEGYRHAVQNSTIYETGRRGVSLRGGDRPTLTRGNSSVVNNLIHSYARINRTGEVGVSVAGVGNRVAHNYIHDAPNAAVWVDGNDQVVEYNELARVMQETGDGGAIYMGKDWTEAGNVIRYNYIHHVDNDVAAGGKRAIYLDDFTTGVTVTGNVIAHVDTAITIGGGRNNVVDNNLIINASNRSMWVDARGVTWGSHAVEPGGVTYNKLLEMPYQDEPWASRYPYLVNILDDEPALPKYNILSDNVLYRAPDVSDDGIAGPHLTLQGNWVTTADNTSPLITYSGTWALQSNNGNFGGSVTYSPTAGDFAELSFSGSVVKVAVRKAAGAGKADVVLDGQVVASDVDTYSPEVQYRQVIYANDALAPGPHTVKVIVKGTKNPQSANTHVFLDYLVGRADMRFQNEVAENYRLLPDSPVYDQIPSFEPIPSDNIGIQQAVDDTSSLITYSGTGWGPSPRFGDFGWSATNSPTAGDFAELTFSGPVLKVAVRKGPSNGMVDVVVDGNVVADDVDTYAAELQYQQLVYTSRILGPGPHTVKVIVTGAKNPASTNTNIQLDFFGHNDRIVMDNTFASIAYSGTGWAQQSNPSDLGGSVRYSPTAGDFAELTFSGSVIEVAVRKGPSNGMVDVVVDGNVVANDIDTYAAELQYQQVIYRSNILGAGQHTVKVIATGTKNPASTNTNVMLDYLYHQ